MLEILEDVLKKVVDWQADHGGPRVWGQWLDHPDEHEDALTLDLKGFRQLESYTCGAVAGLMVLLTFKPRASQKRFFKRANPDREYGTSNSRLVKALRQSGIGVSERDDLTFEDIADLINQGFPIIITVKTKDREVDHWVVIYGIARKPRAVFIAGEGFHLFRSRRTPWAEFRRRWSPQGSGLVCWGK